MRIVLRSPKTVFIVVAFVWNGARPRGAAGPHSNRSDQGAASTLACRSVMYSSGVI